MKFVNKIDGNEWEAEEGTELYKILIINEDYEEVKPKKVKKAVEPVVENDTKTK